MFEFSFSVLEETNIFSSSFNPIPENPEFNSRKSGIREGKPSLDEEERLGLEGKEPELDAVTRYLAMNLQNLGGPLRNDIEVAYKYAMVQNDTQGTILRDGTADHLYYFAQTDPDWADEIFEFEGNGATLRDRGCGTACACGAQTRKIYPSTPSRTSLCAPNNS